MNAMGMRQMLDDGIVVDCRARRSGPVAKKHVHAVVGAVVATRQDGQPRRVETKAGPIGVYPYAGNDIGFDAWWRLPE
jgi:hypothetical protein